MQFTSHDAAERGIKQLKEGGAKIIGDPYFSGGYWNVAYRYSDFADCENFLKDKRRIGSHTHGTFHAYNVHGCRCDLCRAAADRARPVVKR
jgi:hypothetical protein